MVNKQNKEPRCDLTRRPLFVNQVLLRLVATTSHRWLTRLGCPPDEAIVGPYGCPDHSRQPDIQSGHRSVTLSNTDERLMALHLISPKQRIPFFAFGITPYREQLLSDYITTRLFGDIEPSILRFPMTEPGWQPFWPLASQEAFQGHLI
jgi:hypothetical protein